MMKFVLSKQHADEQCRRKFETDDRKVLTYFPRAFTPKFPSKRKSGDGICCGSFGNASKVSSSTFHLEKSSGDTSKPEADTVVNLRSTGLKTARDRSTNTRC